MRVWTGCYDSQLHDNSYANPTVCALYSTAARHKGVSFYDAYQHSMRCVNYEV